MSLHDTWYERHGTGGDSIAAHFNILESVTLTRHTHERKLRVLKCCKATYVEKEKYRTLLGWYSCIT
jgi:hypothetical protein